MEAYRHEEEEVRAARSKVLLANGHRLFRRGLKEILSSSADEDIEVLGEAQDDEEAVKFASEMKPDVVVVDAEEPSVEECKAVERLLECSPALGVVVIALQDGSPRSRRQLLSQGVSSYLDADASPKDLVAAVHTAAGGSRGAGNALLSMPDAVRVEQEETAKYVLSRRELEVLTLAARGLSNRQIANTLRLAEATVKRHLANLYPKLGVGSRGEATRQALTDGWLDVRDLGQDAREQGQSEEVDESYWRGSQVLLRPAG